MMRPPGITDSGLKRIAQEIEVPVIEVSELASFFALRWADVGNPLTNYGAFQEIMGEFLGITSEAFKNLQYSNEWSGVQTPIKEAWEVVQDERLLPSPGSDIFRFSHTIGLRDGIGLDLIQAILTEGLVSQPGGTGQHSESPESVFGVGVSHPSSAEERYNKNYPWVTVDVPLDGTILISGDTHPGGVVYTGAIPPEYIVGVNGITPEMFEAAFLQWGSYGGGE